MEETQRLLCLIPTHWRSVFSHHSCEPRLVCDMEETLQHRDSTACTRPIPRVTHGYRSLLVNEALVFRNLGRSTSLPSVFEVLSGNHIRTRQAGRQASKAPVFRGGLHRSREDSFVIPNYSTSYGCLKTTGQAFHGARVLVNGLVLVHRRGQPLRTVRHAEDERMCWRALRRRRCSCCQGSPNACHAPTFDRHGVLTRVMNESSLRRHAREQPTGKNHGSSVRTETAAQWETVPATGSSLRVSASPLSSTTSLSDITCQRAQLGGR